MRPKRVIRFIIEDDDDEDIRAELHVWLPSYLTEVDEAERELAFVAGMSQLLSRGLLKWDEETLKLLPKDAYMPLGVIMDTVLSSVKNALILRRDGLDPKSVWKELNSPERK